MVSISSVGGLLALNRIKILVVLSLIAVWALADLVPRYQGTIQERIAAQLARTREKIPAIKIDFHPNRDPRTAYNSSKLALLIEGRAPMPHLVPQILHMTSVVPPDWRFLFIGSNRSVSAVGRSFAIKYQQAAGKLDLMVVPEPWDVRDKEHVYRMLTDPRFYDELLPGVEWVMKYESDSIMCGNSGDSLNDWLHYDWAAAPRTETDKFAGNGGLSIRRVSAIRRVLSFQAREDDSEPEDEWFGKRLSTMPNLVVATAEHEKHFSVEELFHERPMGYHLRDGLGHLPPNVWKNKDQRKKIFEYCPDVGIILKMKLEKERCDGDDREGKIDEEVRKEKERERKEKQEKEKEEKEREEREKKEKEEKEKEEKENKGKEEAEEKAKEKEDAIKKIAEEKAKMVKAAAEKAAADEGNAERDEYEDGDEHDYDADVEVEKRP